MATIGLDKLYYAPITEDSNGNETYGTPVQLAKAISAELSIELNEATLFADDGQAEAVKEFKSGTLSLGVDDLGNENAVALVGARIDANGVLVSSGEDVSRYVAIGFRAKNLMENISIFGFIEFYLEFLLHHLLRRVIQLHSQLQQLKVLFFKEIKLMVQISIFGKQKLLKTSQTQQLLMPGMTQFMSLHMLKTIMEVTTNG